MDEGNERKHWIFPYHLGPALTPFATSLLYHDHLEVSLPGWLSPDVWDWFSRVRAVARAKSERLSPVLEAATRVLAEAQEDAIQAVPLVEALNGRIKRVQVLYPGTPSDYVASQELFSAIPGAAAIAFQNPEERKVAATELVWRIFELGILLDSVDEVVISLEQRIEHLPTPWHLLGECYFHRFTVARSKSPIALITNSEAALTILGQIGKEAQETTFPLSPIIEEQLTFTLFEALLSDYVPDLSNKENAATIERLMTERADELAKFKEATAKSARELQAADPSKIETAFTDIVSTLSSAIEKIANLDRTKRNELYTNLTEDKTLWLSVASLLGTALMTLPAVVPASLAVTAFTSLGTTALKLRRARERTLSESPWSFVYYARKSKK